MRKPYGHATRRAEARRLIGWLVPTGGRLRCTTALALVVTIAGLLASCATAPATREDKAALVAEASSRWQQMRTADPALGALVQLGHGYALFPDVGKAGLLGNQGVVLGLYGGRYLRHDGPEHVLAVAPLMLAPLNRH